MDEFFDPHASQAPKRKKLLQRFALYDLLFLFVISSLFMNGTSIFRRDIYGDFHFYVLIILYLAFGIN